MVTRLEPTAGYVASVCHDGSSAAAVAVRGSAVLSESESANLKKVLDAYEMALHAKTSIVDTLSDAGQKVADLAMGVLTCLQGSMVMNAPPVGASFGSALFAMRGLSDFAKVPVTVLDAVGSVGTLLLDPSAVSMVGLANKTGEFAKVITRVGFALAVVAGTSLHPMMAVVNLWTTVGCGLIGALGEAKVYVISLAERRAALANGEEGSSTGQIVALLNLAANVSLIAMGVIGLKAVSCSMIPVTVAGGAAMASAAGFGLMAKWYQLWSAPQVGHAINHSHTE